MPVCVRVRVGLSVLHEPQLGPLLRAWQARRGSWSSAGSSPVWSPPHGGTLLTVALRPLPPAPVFSVAAPGDWAPRFPSGWGRPVRGSGQARAAGAPQAVRVPRSLLAQEETEAPGSRGRAPGDSRSLGYSRGPGGPADAPDPPPQVGAPRWRSPTRGPTGRCRVRGLGCRPAGARRSRLYRDLFKKPVSSVPLSGRVPPVPPGAPRPAFFGRLSPEPSRSPRVLRPPLLGTRGTPRAARGSPGL